MYGISKLYMGWEETIHPVMDSGKLHGIVIHGSGFKAMVKSTRDSSCVK